MSIKIEDLTISDISTEISQTDVDISLIPAMWNDLNKLKNADSSSELLSDALFNTKAGTEVLNSLTTGNKNSVLGYQALYTNTAGYNNSAIGYQALNKNTTGNYNTGLGYYALYGNISGSYNIGIGGLAGLRIFNASIFNTTCTNSIYIGYDTRTNANGDTNEIVIGDSAIGQGSNTIMLGNSSITGLYCYDTSIASPSDRRVKENITEIGDSKLLEFIEKLEPITYNKKNQCDWDDKIKLSTFKDIEIEEIKDGKKVKKIKKAEKRPKTNDRTYAGLIAQDVEKAMKDTGVDYELVNTASNGMKTLRYGDLIPALIGAVKELKKEIDELRKTK